MAHQIIVQPDGKLCVFSSVTDTFIVTDASDRDLIKFYAEWAFLEAARGTKELINGIREGNNPYYHFKITYEEASARNKHSLEGVNEVE